MKYLDITIGEEGQVSVEAKGFSGNSCEKAVEELECELGLVKNKKKKSEYFQKEKQNVSSLR